MDLTGKTALVTGGSLGLGRAMAAAFHSAGANVALLARRDSLLTEAKEEIEQTDVLKQGRFTDRSRGDVKEVLGTVNDFPSAASSAAGSEPLPAVMIQNFIENPLTVPVAQAIAPLPED